MSDPRSATDSPDPRRRLGWTALIPLGFVVAALVALAVLPYLTGQGVEESRQAVTRLQPVRSMSLRYEDLLRRGMTSLESYLLTGDEEHRRRHESTRAEEDSASVLLRTAVEDAGIPVRTELAELLNRTASWHVRHADLIAGLTSRDEFAERLERELAQQAEVMAALDEFERRVEQSQAAAWGRLDEALRDQRWMTLLLVALALVGTAAVAFLAFRMRSLGQEAERRTRDAVRARRQIDAILAATGEGILGMDLDGRLTFLNRAGAELLGYTRAEIMGEDAHDLIHPVDVHGAHNPRETCPVLAVLEHGRPATLPDEALRRRDGTFLPVQLAVRPMVDGTRIQGLVMTFTDLTEIRKAEDALKEAMKAREDVLQVVSHDLRNPIGSISFAAAFLLESDVPEEKRRESLRRIRSAADRAGRMISDLLDVARLERGSFPVRRSPVWPVALLEDAAETGQALAARRDHTLEVQLDEGLPRVEADRDRVVQALSNLLGNAFKYTPEGGRITLLGRKGDDGHVVLGVRDTGPGIPEEDRGRLFERFWQGKEQPEAGTGLGLSIVQAIVTAHGGRIWVESREEEGSTFLFTLPVSDGDPSAS